MIRNPMIIDELLYTFHRHNFGHDIIVRIYISKIIRSRMVSFRDKIENENWRNTARQNKNRWDPPKELFGIQRACYSLKKTGKTINYPLRFISNVVPWFSLL